MHRSFWLIGLPLLVVSLTSGVALSTAGARAQEPVVLAYDADCDGDEDIEDALAVLRHMIGQQVACMPDVDGNGSVDATDVAMILSAVSGGEPTIAKESPSRTLFASRYWYLRFR